MKLPLMSLAPETHQQKLAVLATPFRWGPPTRFLLILVSIVLGAVTHVVWDSFTHDRGYAVRNLPDLRTPPLQAVGNDRPMYNVLQHGSSVAGLAILAFWYWRWSKRTPAQPVPEYLKMRAAKKAWITAMILITAGSLSLIYAYAVSDHLARLRRFAGVSVVMFLSLVFVEVVGFGLWWHWKQRAFSTQPEQDRVIW